MEQLIVQFPALAAYLIVAGGGLFATMVGFGFRTFLKRMDKQDAALEALPEQLREEIDAVKKLIQQEIKELREGQHRLANRVVSMEAFAKAKFGFEHPAGLSAPADRIP